MSAPDVTYCKRCLMPSSRPRIEFDGEGVCSACRYHETKNAVDWKEREREFRELIKANPGNGYHDCIVPWSGGKDSSAVAIRLKRDYGLNPLLVTYSPMLPTPVGDHNREALIKKGFDNVYFRPNQHISRTLARRFFIERGNPEVHRAAGINALPVQEAKNRGIKLILFAEHGESEYGGHILSEEHRKFRFLDEVIEHQVGDHPLNWAGDGITEKELAPYLYPDDVSGLTVTYFGYWHRWDVIENLHLVEDLTDFRRCFHGRSDGTWTDYDSLDDMIDDTYYYLQFVKFGFGRALRDAARAIQNKHLTREEAIAMTARYDGEFPRTFLNPVLDYLGMDESVYRTVIDQHRNEEIWQQERQGWTLKTPLTA